MKAVDLREFRTVEELSTGEDRATITLVREIEHGLAASAFKTEEEGKDYNLCNVIRENMEWNRT